MDLDRVKFLIQQRNWHVEQLMKINLRASLLIIAALASVIAGGDKLTGILTATSVGGWIAITALALAGLCAGLTLRNYFRLHSVGAQAAAELALAEMEGDRLATSTPDIRFVLAPMPDPDYLPARNDKWPNYESKRFTTNRLTTCTIVLACLGLALLAIALLFAHKQH